MKALCLQDIWKRFDSGGPWILEALELEVEAGELVAVVGPSGCGKSTLLHLAGTLDPPDRGRVLLGGTDVDSLNSDQLAAIRREQLGFVFQDHYLLPHLTALENTLLPTLADGSWRPASADVERARSLFVQLDLEDRADYRPAQLSTGQRQRVAVARALIREPRLVLADEPTGALDRRSAESLVEILRAVCGASGVLVVTHAESVAHAADRVLALVDGALIERPSRE